MMLSRHFALDEFVNSSAARIHKIANVPDAAAMAKLAYTAMKMEEVRELLGRHPIIITSGYRSALLNKVVGGSKTSQHMTGEAVDFICPNFGTPADIVAKIKHSDIQFDQCVCEFYDKNKPGSGWVHISFNDKPRRQALWIDENGSRQFA